MKKKKIGLCMSVFVSLLLIAGCGAITELVLDDTWALKEIQAGSLIATNLGDYLSVEFDSADNQVTFTAGPEWGELSGGDPTGIYDFSVDGTETTITLYQNEEAKHVITYEFDSALDQMTWVRWEAVDTDPKILFISSDSIIKNIVFERIE